MKNPCFICRILLLLLLAILSGCHPSSESPMMPTPALFWGGGADPLPEAPMPQQKTLVQVFYAGDDEPVGHVGHRNQALKVGSATLQIGKDKLSSSEVRQLSLMKKRSRKLTTDLKSVVEYGVLSSTMPPLGLRKSGSQRHSSSAPADKRFIDQINKELAKSRKKTIQIYVHGFNSPFNDSLTILGQMHYYMRADGIALAYTWPSQGSFLRGYHADKNNARFTVRHFRQLLDFLAKNTDVETINILAHSAGAPIVVDALRHIRLIHNNENPVDIQKQSKIGLVILASPDGDLDWFINACLDGWMQSAKRVHVYASKADLALKLARGVFEAPRTGEAVMDLNKNKIEALQKLGKLSIIDATNAKHYNVLFSGHSYYHLNAWASSDVLLAIQFGISPGKRGLVRAPGQGYYTFPADYDQRVKAIAKALYKSESRQR